MSRPIIVTGASSGIGAAITRLLCERGQRVIMACRNVQKAEDFRQRLPQPDLAEVLPLDLASCSSIRDFCGVLLRRGEPIGALMNNAGTMSNRFALTTDGFETTMGVNYIGPYLLSRLLVPLLSDDAVVLNTISCTYCLGRIGEDPFVLQEREYGKFKAYTASKMALALFGAEFSRRTGIRVLAVDPGVVDTGMISMGKWYDPIADRLFRPLIRTAGAAAEISVNAYLRKDEFPQYAVIRSKKNSILPERVLSHLRRTILWEQTEAVLEQNGICF